MSIERRLRKLEDRAAPKETPDETEKRRKTIRELAEHSNHCNEGRGEETLFEIDENGDVFCSRDGRPVTDSHQTLAEEFYWIEVGWGPSPGLVHDEEAQAFYTPSGELALSRECVILERLMGPGREERSAEERQRRSKHE
jgi:hypothetical protein